MIRSATTADVALVHELWREFDAEIPDAPWRDDDSEDDLRELEHAIGKDVVLIAEEDGRPVGLSVAEKKGVRVGFLHILYVRPDARQHGVAAELVRETVTQLGTEVLELDVLDSNHAARAVYERWGFSPVEHTLGVRADELAARLVPHETGPTYGVIHVQTDDADAVERAAHKALPRFGRSESTEVTGPDNGWVHVRDALCDREPKILHALGKELSYATGGVVLSIGVERGAVVHYTLYDRGGAVDEYLSVPEFYGPLPPGDVVALGANPTVVARLTGAEPRRVREVARTAALPSELPPAEELYAQLTEVFGC